MVSSKWIVLVVVLFSVGIGTGKEQGWGPFEWPWEAFFDMLAAMMDDMTQVILAAMQQTDDLITEMMNSMSAAMLQLSDDILEMADKIGEMSLQIGIMADRIVQTEILLVDMMLIMTGHENSTIPIPPVGNYTWGSCTPPTITSAPVVMFSPQDNEVVSRDEIPSFLFSVPLGEELGVVLYASQDPAMPDGQTTSVFASNLKQIHSWQRVVDSQSDNRTMYIAVRLVNLSTGTVSGISNSVILYL